MSYYKDLTEADVKRLMNNDSFCSLAWTHLHQAPNASLSGCCIAKGTDEPVLADTIYELINHEYMKNLRRNMMAGIKNPECEICYNHERDFGDSFRIGKNLEYEDQLPDMVRNTQRDGTLDDFKMLYYDIRFSNVCNMKCRSCGPTFSSLWENEIKIHDIKGFGGPQSGVSPAQTNLLEDILDNHLINVETAYFAGGEPLVNDEHYAILNKLIELEKFDTNLTYNTNASIIKYKNYDLIELWSNFNNSIELVASIDHMGDRAEYIRSGTNWDKVSNNLKILSKTNNVDLSINSVISALNYVTIDELFMYLVENDIVTAESNGHMNCYMLHQPDFMCAQNLPVEIKQEGKRRNLALIEWLKERGFQEDKHTISSIRSAIDYVELNDNWEEQRTNFVSSIKFFDNVRKENFVKTFPELASMFDA